MKTWLSETIAGRKVEKIPCPYINSPISMKVPTGVMHTTEGSWSSAMSVFRQHYAPHFLVGVDGRIAQLVPLGKMAAALKNAPGGYETNRWCHQIEVEGRSQAKAYDFPPAQQRALAELMATLEVEAGIPLKRPFSDVMPPLPWATPNFARRRAGHWGRTPGWYGHVEVPENDHWDPGALRWSKLLAMASLVKPKPKPQPVRYETTFYQEGKVYKRLITKWPRTAILATNLVARGITDIRIRRIDV